MRTCWTPKDWNEHVINFSYGTYIFLALYFPREKNSALTTSKYTSALHLIWLQAITIILTRNDMSILYDLQLSS